MEWPASDMTMLMTIGWLLAAFLITALLVRGAIGYTAEPEMIHRDNMVLV